MLLVKKNDLEVVSSGRLVKAADVAAVKTADEIIAAAEAEAARLKMAAVQAYEDEKRRGFEEGLQKGLKKVIEDKLDFVYESAAHMESLEGKLADIVIKALYKCVSQIGDKTLVIEIIRKIMKAVVRNQRQIVLRSHLIWSRRLICALTRFLQIFPCLSVLRSLRMRG
jgi:type III secretion protein L